MEFAYFESLMNDPDSPDLQSDAAKHGIELVRLPGTEPRFKVTSSDFDPILLTQANLPHIERWLAARKSYRPIQMALSKLIIWLALGFGWALGPDIMMVIIFAAVVCMLQQMSVRGNIRYLHRIIQFESSAHQLASTIYFVNI